MEKHKKISWELIIPSGRAQYHVWEQKNYTKINSLATYKELYFKVAEDIPFLVI